MRNRILLFLALLLVVGVSASLAGQSPPADLSKAQKFFSEGKYPEALALYRKAADQKPGTAAPGQVYSRIGDCHFKLGDYKHAIEAYRTALPLQKGQDQAPTQYWIGFSTLMLGNNAQAVTELLKVPELYPGSGMWVSTAYYWAGKASERMGRKDQAAAYYRKAAGSGASAQERYALQKAASAGAH